MLAVRLKAPHIRKGKTDDCYHCALALALQEATGDTDANVYSSLDGYYLEVWGRHLHIPPDVWDFVWRFDRKYDRRKDGRLALPRRLPDDMRPRVFELPDLDDKEWREKCYHCEELCDADDLDGEGVCEHCRKKAGGP